MSRMGAVLGTAPIIGILSIIAIMIQTELIR